VRTHQTGKLISAWDAEMTTAKTIAVIGGGIGGMTAALSLLRRGIDVEVYEQAARLEEVGAGIQISANGTRILAALGLEEALREIQVSPLRKEIRHWRTGQVWKWYDLGPSADRRYGAPHVLLHRGDLHDTLIKGIKSLKPDAIHLAKRCVDVRQSGDRVDLRFADGDAAQARFVIGADGIHSQIRAHLFGLGRPEFTGCVAWRAVVPVERLSTVAEPMVSTNWLGPRGHVLHYPLRGGTLMNFLGIVERDDWRGESWTIEGTPSELANDFAGWHPRVQAMVQSIDRPFKWALMVRAPMPKWSKGHVTLLGDACHPTLPFLGQGGVMAIEDAYVIAACLAKYYDEPAKAGERYEEIRRERTAAVVRKSHENRKQAFHPELSDHDDAIRIMAEDWQQSLAKERLDWLYTYDATAIDI
jgi:2-polyprenyl-6-methoxyphenol hydroxylase-like FAD-dependent oxidoreductase